MPTSRNNTPNQSKAKKLNSKNSIPKKPQRLDPITTEISLCNRGIQTETISPHVLALQYLLALDLSYNAIDSCPRGLPPSLLALNLSYNMISNCSSFKISSNLIELHLANNQIHSTIGLGYLKSLQHLNLSYNQIKVIEGMETLEHLETLLLSNNQIVSTLDMRALQFNRELKTLDVSFNGVSSQQGYRSILAQLIPSLKLLSNVKISHKNSKLAYNIAHRRKNNPDEIVRYSDIYGNSPERLLNYSSSLLPLSSSSSTIVTPVVGTTTTHPTLFSIAYAPIISTGDDNSHNNKEKDKSNWRSDARELRILPKTKGYSNILLPSPSIKSFTPKSNHIPVNITSTPIITHPITFHRPKSAVSMTTISSRDSNIGYFEDRDHYHDNIFDAEISPSPPKGILDSLPWRKPPTLIPRPRRPFTTTPLKSRYNRGVENNHGKTWFNRDRQNENRVDEEDEEDSIDPASIVSYNYAISSNNKVIVPEMKSRVIQRTPWISSRLTLEQQNALVNHMYETSTANETELAVAAGEYMASKSYYEGDQIYDSSSSPPSSSLPSPLPSPSKSPSKSRPYSSYNQSPRELSSFGSTPILSNSMRTKASLLRDSFIKDQIDDRELSMEHDRQKQVYHSIDHDLKLYSPIQSHNSHFISKESSLSKPTSMKTYVDTSLFLDDDNKNDHDHDRYATKDKNKAIMESTIQEILKLDDNEDPNSPPKMSAYALLRKMQEDIYPTISSPVVIPQRTSTSSSTTSTATISNNVSNMNTYRSHFNREPSSPNSYYPLSEIPSSSPSHSQRSPPYSSDNRKNDLAYNDNSNSYNHDLGDDDDNDNDTISDDTKRLSEALQLLIRRKQETLRMLNYAKFGSIM